MGPLSNCCEFTIINWANQSEIPPPAVVGSPKGRKPGRSQIATDTLEKEALRMSKIVKQIQERPIKKIMLLLN